MVTRRDVLIGALSAAAVLSAGIQTASASPVLPENICVTDDYEVWRKVVGNAEGTSSLTKFKAGAVDSIPNFRRYLLAPTAVVDGKAVVAESRTLKCRFTTDMFDDTKFMSTLHGFDAEKEFHQIIMAETHAELLRLQEITGKEVIPYMINKSVLFNHTEGNVTKYIARFALV